ncbi:hypothetical protein EVAR_30880_1 [Eumeta japonica]|uniref:Uncharacterized protein n=1 Tax=Eumeta variegata TaxID=151549 RepID=A0A4C1V4S5_EUMVA|nr:hypothetical protein EVAR_30880_1 [Eumeta japonica]
MESIQMLTVSKSSCFTNNADNVGRAPDQFQFHDEIDEFLGHKPANSSQHSMGSLPKKNDEENKENKEDTSKKTRSKKRSEKKKKRSEDDEESRLLLKKAKLELAKKNCK